jgi:hypothetical protein
LRGLEDKREDNIKKELGVIGSIHPNWLGQNYGFYELTFGFHDVVGFLDHLNNNKHFKEDCTIELVSRSGLSESRLEALLPC